MTRTSEDSVWRGVFRFEKGDYAAAERDLSTAVDSDPDRFGWALLCRAACRVALGKSLPALTDLERYLCRHPAAPAAAVDDLRRLALSGRAWRREPRASALFWKDTARARVWESRFGAAQGIYAEMEYATVREGVRSILFCNAVPADPFLTRVERDGLRWRTLFRVKKYGGFAHQHVIAEENDPDSWRHVVVARDERTIEEVVALHRRELDAAAHSRLGSLLGFPPCCVSFFERHWFERRNWDPLFEAGLNTKPRAGPGARRGRAVAGHPHCNTLLRYVGLRAASWLTCSFDCPDTIARVGRWLELGRRIDGEAVESLLAFLGEPAVWKSSGGATFVDAKDFRIISDSGAPRRERVLRWRARTGR
jgi:hypothetical protein